MYKFWINLTFTLEAYVKIWYRRGYHKRTIEITREITIIDTDWDKAKEAARQRAQRTVSNWRDNLHGTPIKIQESDYYDAKRWKILKIPDACVHIEQDGFMDYSTVPIEKCWKDLTPEQFKLVTGLDSKIHP